MTPDTGSEHFILLLMLRGVGLSLLFMPITTLALSGLKGREIGDGASFTGMMRQLGGSFGIAIITTYLATQNAVHRANLVNHLSSFSLEVQQRVMMFTQNFISKGFAPNEAQNKAYQILDFSVAKQAAVLAYMDVFLVLGFMFLACIPFILFAMKGNVGTKVDASNMH